jgi:hypothetical protein
MVMNLLVVVSSGQNRVCHHFDQAEISHVERSQPVDHGSGTHDLQPACVWRPPVNRFHRTERHWRAAASVRSLPSIACEWSRLAGRWVDWMKLALR